MGTPTPEELDVPVRGGSLAVLRWPGDGPVVLAAHGITANALSWALVAQALDGAATLVAPDLRGRARSSALPGPHGMAVHADDLVAVLDHLGASDAVLAGHSMGAFVAAVTAVRNPHRVSGLVLVDGGVPFPTPPGSDIDALLTAVIGPAMQRLRMTLPSHEAWLAFWREHPALGPDWSPAMEAYVHRDLAGVPPEIRSACRLDAVRVDGAQVLQDEETLGAVRHLPGAATLLWASRGMQNEAQGLYDEERLGYAALPPNVRPTKVDDVNHYTILLAEPGARAVAAAIRTATQARSEDDPSATTR